LSVFVKCGEDDKCNFTSSNADLAGYLKFKKTNELIDFLEQPAIKAILTDFLEAVEDLNKEAGKNISIKDDEVHDMRINPQYRAAMLLTTPLKPVNPFNKANIVPATAAYYAFRLIEADTKKIPQRPGEGGLCCVPWSGAQ
jgi:hypothetical protein